MRRLLKIFQSKYASLFCILFAIANRVIFATVYSTIGKDASLQLAFAKNWLRGNGMGITKYYSVDLQKPVFDTLQEFPPGYSFAIAPFLTFFKNEYDAVFAFDILIMVLFILSIRFLGKQLGLSTALNNLLTLIVGCSQYAFIMQGPSTDSISLMLSLFVLGMLIKIATNQQSLKWSQVFFFSVIFYLPSFFRYMYIPVSFVFPLIIIGCGFYYKNSLLKSSGLKLAAVTYLFLFLSLFLSYLFNGNSVYAYNSGRGLFPEHLIHWYPFIPASFINLDFFAQTIARLPAMNYTNVFSLFELVNICLSLVLIYYLFRYILLKGIKFTKSSIFIISSGTISFVILLMLAYFSFTYKPQVSGISIWNYNYEPRYFAFIYIFLQVLLMFCLSIYESVKNFFLKALLSLGLVLLLVEVLHGIYYNVKIVAERADVLSAKNRLADYKQFPVMLKELTGKYSDREFLVCSSDRFFLNKASELGYKAIFDYANLNTTSLVVQKKSMLLFPIFEGDIDLMKEYLKNKRPQLLGKIATTQFYLQELNP